MSGTSSRVARNASYTFGGNLVAFVAGAVASVVLARMLRPAQLGTYALVLMAAGVMAMLVTTGIPHAATKYVAEYDARGERETALRVLGALARVEIAMAVAVGTIAFVSAPWLERSFGAPGFAPAFRIAAAALPVTTLAGLILAGLQGVQDYRRITLISLVGTVVLFSGTIGLLVVGAGVPGAIGAFAITGALTATLGAGALRKHGLSLFRASLPSVSIAKLRRYVPAVGAVLLLDAVVWQRSEVLFLGVFRSREEVAWYALAFGIAATVMRLIPRALAFVLPPVASGLYGRGDPVGMQVLFRTGSRYLAILAAPLVVGGAVVAEPLLVNVYGEGYRRAALVLPLLMLAAGVGAVGSVTASIQNGIERQDLVLKVALAATAVNLGLDVWLIPAWGIVGAAVANLVAQTGAVIAGIVVSAPLVGVSFPAGDCLRALAAAGATGVVAYPVVATVRGVAGVVVGVLAGALAYPPALLAVGVLRAEDLERLDSVRELVPARLRPGYGGLVRLAGRWAA